MLACALPSYVRIVLRKNASTVLLKADVVIASCLDAVQAMVDAKPCIILGNYGLGGMVCQNNYDILQKYNFQGRAGASFQEYIPIELLSYEINKSLHFDNKKEIRWLEKRVTEDYNETLFQEKINERVISILSVSRKLRNKKTRLQLKPICTSIISKDNLNNTTYLTMGYNYYRSTDKELCRVLEQCNGQNTIQDIGLAIGYSEEEISILSANLQVLEKKKLLIFYE
jgi:hypothetical protein